MNYLMKLPSLKNFFVLVLLSCYSFISAQYNVPEPPSKIYPVYDEVGLLNATETEEINQKLIKFADSSSTEILVVIIPTTNGEDVNFVATQWGEKWKIGEKEQDNGVVFLIATEDRKMSIQQGRGVEQYLTASVSQWFAGINAGTSAIMDAVRGKFKPLSESEPQPIDISLKHVLIFALILFFIIYILSKNNNGGGFGNDDGDVILTRRGRRVYPGGFFPGSFGGGFGGGSSGGGFGGFGGGGSFGGGGASGGW